MVKTLKDRWSATADRIVATALSAATPEETLSILGTAIRKYRTARDRMGTIAEILSKVAIQVMVIHNIYEQRVTTRTFMAIVQTFKISSGARGDKAYKNLVEEFGQGFADGLYVVTEEVIPATIIKKYSLDEDALEALNPEVRRNVARTLDLSQKLDVVDVPKRVKEGKPRGKRKRK